jgi:hypothetical protein
VYIVIFGPSKGYGCFVKKIIDLFKTLTSIKGIVVSSRPITVGKFPYGLNDMDCYYVYGARIGEALVNR